MATKTTETVTPNPLSPEQVAFNQGSIDAESLRNDLVRQLSPLLVDLMKTGGSDSDFITQTLRGAGIASDEALALARGVPYDPTGSQPAIAALYRQELGREPDQAGLDWWTKQATNGTSLASIRQNFQNTAQQGTDPLAPPGFQPQAAAQAAPQGEGDRAQAVRLMFRNRNLPPPTAQEIAQWTDPALGTLSDIEDRIIQATPAKQWASDAEQFAQFEANKRPDGSIINPYAGGPGQVYADKMFSGDQLTDSGRSALTFMGYGQQQSGTGGQRAPSQGLGLAPGQPVMGQGPVPESYRSAPFDPTADYNLIAQNEDAAIAAGEKDLDRFLGDAMQILQDQAAASGMRFRDSPILDRGGKIATDVLRQKEDLAQGIRSQGMSLRLTYPLEKYTTLSNVGVNEGRLGLDTRSLAQNAEQFNSEMNLRNRTLGADVAQRGIENRLAATNALMDRYNFGVNSGLNLLSVTRPNAPQFPNQGSTGTSSTSGSSTSSLLGAAGGLLEGVGAITSGGGILKGVSKLFSSRALKDVHENVIPDKALEGVMNTPVSRWSYKGETTPHIGPMAEDFQQSFNIGDGKTISVIDAIGVLFAAVQGLGQRVEGMHHAIE